MKKLILLLIFLLTCSAKAVWLTNGIAPNSITYFGNITGSGMGDVFSSYDLACYINISTKENPELQYYKQIKINYLSTAITIYKKSNNKYYGDYSSDSKILSLESDCSFNEQYEFNINKNNRYGNDIISNGFIDAAINSSGVLKFGFGSGNNDSRPFSRYFTEHFIKRQNGTLISIDSGQKVWLADIDSDNEYEGIVNSSSNIASYYELTTPTNWVYVSTCKNIQCFGDWDDDGLEDFMFYDGEVFLAVPEPVILHFLLIATIFSTTKKILKITCN